MPFVNNLQLFTPFFALSTTTIANHLGSNLTTWYCIQRKKDACFLFPSYATHKAFRNHWTTSTPSSCKACCNSRSWLYRMLHLNQQRYNKFSHIHSFPIDLPFCTHSFWHKPRQHFQIVLFVTSYILSVRFLPNTFTATLNKLIHL